MDPRIKTMKKEVTDELLSILSFWQKNDIDDINGGFIGSIELNMTKHPESEKGCVLNARILWTFSAAYRVLKKPELLTLATRAYVYNTKHFFDSEFGGCYWMLNADGSPKNTRKQIYAIAFMMYALVDYYKITKNKNALEKAVGLFEVIEKYSFDKERNGYYEAYSKDWKLLEDMRLSEIDKNDPKTMNTHLHILEAYANLYRVYKDEKLKNALKNLIVNVFVGKIINNEKGYFDLFFAEDWKHESEKNSYGHDIEGSWLLWEAAEILEDEEVKNQLKPICLKMADQVLQFGLDKDGGLMNEGTNGVVENSDKHWWVQAESVVGFMNAYQLSKDEKYLNASLSTWEFIKNFIIDKENGEWYHSVSKDEHKVYTQELKAGPWKCPYHNSRMCLEIIQRFPE
jgi:mannobiose 2-epimerase